MNDGVITLMLFAIGAAVALIQSHATDDVVNERFRQCVEHYQLEPTTE